MNIKVKLDEGAYMPERAHKWDAGFDLKTPKEFFLYQFDQQTVDTGVHVEIPEGYVGILKSKSGLNKKFGITSTGTIDAGYSGSIQVTMHRHDEHPGAAMERFDAGNKITQLVILPLADIDELVQVDEIKSGERGDNGFGSTGR